MANKLNIIGRMQRWMDSVPGQTFMNYAYSWGAAVVILGTLFKLTHIAGANLMLFIGMGTEVFVFFVSGFDRPFDKSEKAEIAEDAPDPFDFEAADPDEVAAATTQATPVAGAPVVGGGVVGGVVGGGVIGGGPVVVGEGEGSVVAGGTTVVGGGSGTVIIGGGNAGGVVSAQPAAVAAPAPSGDVVSEVLGSAIDKAMPEGGDEAERLASIIRLANDELLRRAQAVLAPEMEAASQDYIQKLRTLTETLEKMDEQSSRLTQDSQEMENLNRTLIGINKIYELHFASISKQVTTIEQINEQTRELASKIDEVNQIYARMMQQLNIMANPASALQQG